MAHPSPSVNKSIMAPDYPRHSPHIGTTTQNPYSPYRSMPFMRRGHTSTSHHGMWRRYTSMGMDETARGSYAKEEPRWAPEEWLFRPQFELWTPQRHRVVLWVLAQFVAFRSQKVRNLTSQDYLGFLRRSKWELY